MYQKVKAIFMRKIFTWPQEYLPDDPYNINNPFQDNYTKNKNIYESTSVNQIWLRE